MQCAEALRVQAYFDGEVDAVSATQLERHVEHCPECRLLLQELNVVRTALIPVVTLVALQLPIVFGGAIVTEQIFRVPGIGSLLISAMLANDTPVVMAVTFVFACLVVIFNLIADILYGWLDPRISYR